MRRFITRAAVAALLVAAPGARAGAQETAARFEVAAVQDSTFRFAVGRQRWVAPAHRGIVVDPMHRDALVARFRVLSVHGDTATALITGETTRVTDQHVALINVPPAKWWKTSYFWRGAVVGALTGLGAGLAF